MSDESNTFKIQPHPATTNDPKTDPALNQGAAQSTGNPTQAAPGIQILDSKTAANLEKPLSKEEIAKRSAELNK
ncbi:hypothetical protein MSPP1_003481 [Malassezia sp. CBS 17886]|nr:hypothetical protein MSPP1_003481 [Malassezia sp. CBS 17886]